MAWNVRYFQILEQIINLCLTYIIRCKTLHSLPKFASKTQRIQVENGHCYSVVYHTNSDRYTSLKYEILTLMSEIHENVDLVLKIKNIFELEGTINS